MLSEHEHRVLESRLMLSFICFIIAGFGTATQNPFGQSQLFGKPAGSTFGNTPPFGTASGTTLFPSSQAQASGLFPSASTPAFGTASTAQTGFGK